MDTNNHSENARMNPDEFQNLSRKKRSKRVDQLPPHSDEAELGLLSCIFQENGLLTKLREQFAGEQVFYDLKHALILRVCCTLADSGAPIDPLTAINELRRLGELDQVGGVTFVANIPDFTPSAANFEAYLKIVWEKYLARKLMGNAARTLAVVQSTDGVNEAVLGQISREHEEFLQKSQRGSVSPRYLRQVVDFAEETCGHFFGASKREAPGLELPWPFPLRIRRREATLIFGDDGSGKSTVLSEIILHLVANEGEKAVLASFEMPPAITAWIMAAQLIGQKALTETPENMQTAQTALAWLNRRVIFYDFQGIADWREVHDTFRYAAEKEVATFFSIDNAMRMGIADDDYAQQAFAASAFHSFADKHNAHVAIVLHENKGDSKGKAKIRGSKLWSANMNNVLRIARNEDKAEKIDKAKFAIDVERARGKDGDAIAIRDEEKKLATLQTLWDSQIVLHKQRYPGTRQNASKYLWFDPKCFQFRDDYRDGAVNWLQRWKGRK